MHDFPYGHYVVASGLTALAVSLAVGPAVVWLCRWSDFRSREIKEGVTGKRRDQVPMGGGFIFLVAISTSVLILWSQQQIRLGYAICFLIPVWGFAILGFMDDWSKAHEKGISDRVKVGWQIGVGFTFATAFWLYASGRFVVLDETTEWGRLTLPFGGPISLGILYVPFLFIFLIGVANSVNFTDGFNGLAGGTAAIVALFYTLLTFATGVSELHPGGQVTPLAQRMFALAIMSAAIGGGLLGFLYFNHFRATIFMGDTGSMALGAALTFLAVFSQTECLFLVIAGVFFIEGLSAVLQRSWAALLERILAASLIQRIEISRPFIIAPLHHHFETLALREIEPTGEDLNRARDHIRYRITYTAWILGTVLGGLGLLAYFIHFDLFWSGGVLLGVAVLGGSIISRFLRDCYFIGTGVGKSPDSCSPRNQKAPEVLTLYRGLPLEWGTRRFYHVYEETTIPLANLSLLNQQGILFRPLYSRVDARLLLGLLYLDRALQSPETEQIAWLRGALNFWEKIPPERLMIKNRHIVLLHMANGYHKLHQFAQAIRTLSYVPVPYQREMEIPQRIEAIQNEAWQIAEKLYQQAFPREASDSPPRGEEKRILVQTLEAHCELCAILDHRLTQNRNFRARIMEDGNNPRSPVQYPASVGTSAPHSAGLEDRLANLDAEASLMQQAFQTIYSRCERIRRRLSSVDPGLALPSGRCTPDPGPSTVDCPPPGKAKPAMENQDSGSPRSWESRRPH